MFIPNFAITALQLRTMQMGQRIQLLALGLQQIQIFVALHQRAATKGHP